MNYHENDYLKTLRRLITNGDYREGRNGATYSLFGTQLKFDLRAGFPLLTTKETWFHGIKVELIWMLSGSTNIEYLLKNNVHIWDEWADEHGDLGPVYGAQWRHWGNPRYENYGGEYVDIDQMEGLINGIKNDPYGRRHIVTAWNPEQLDQMKLPPCHCFFQCHVSAGLLNLHLYQRSADWFLGVPFNIASYALLTHLIARECGLEAGELTMSFGDYHLYANHLEAAQEQLRRTPLPFPELSLPELTPETSIFNIKPNQIELSGYNHHGKIKAEVSA